jgi:hypothetical protein
MQTLALGLCVAPLMNRTLVVDWRDPMYSSRGENSFDTFFSLRGVDWTTEVPATNSVFPRFWRGRLHSYPDDHLWVRVPWVGRRHDHGVLSQLDRDETALVFWAWYWNDEHHALLQPQFEALDHPFASMKKQEIMRLLLRRHLVLASAIQRDVDAFVNQNFGSATVGVHVRHTDRKVPLTGCYQQLDAALDSEPEAGIFLATDNREVEEGFRARYATRSFVAAPKWFPEAPGEPIHRALPSRGQRSQASTLAGKGGSSGPSAGLSPIGRDKVRMGREALVDMCALARCEYLVYSSGSSFSEMAMLLSSAPPQRRLDAGDIAYPASVVLVVGPLASKPRECLDRLSVQTYPQSLTEVICVTYGGVELCEEWRSRHTRARFLESTTDHVYEALNLGVQAATGEVVGLLDGHCVPDPDWLSAGVEAIRSYPTTGLAIGQIEYTRVGRLASPLVPYLRHNRRVLVDSQSLKVDPFVNVFMPVHTFNDVGGFDSSLGDAAGAIFERDLQCLGYYRSIYADNARVRNHRPIGSWGEAVRTPPVRPGLGLLRRSTGKGVKKYGGVLIKYLGLSQDEFRSGALRAAVTDLAVVGGAFVALALNLTRAAIRRA